MKKLIIFLLVALSVSYTYAQKAKPSNLAVSCGVIERISVGSDRAYYILLEKSDAMIKVESVKDYLDPKTEYRAGNFVWITTIDNCAMLTKQKPSEQTLVEFQVKCTLKESQTQKH